MVIGTNNSSEVISNITHRIIGFPQTSANLVFAGPSSGSAQYPTLRRLTADDLPDSIPANKISGLTTDFVTFNSLKNKGDTDTPIYFNSDGVAVASPNKFSNYKTIASLAGKGSSTQPIYFDSSGNAVAISYSIAKSVPSNAVFTDTNTTYAFVSGNGSFTVTPSGGSAQNVSIGKPATAGTADKAIQLNTARKLKVNLSSTADATFNGTADALNIPVGGTLPLNMGGTGRNTGWINNGVIYKSPSSESFESVAASGSNQVLMSSSSGLTPTWRLASDVVSSVDWSNLNGWNNTYVWDSINTNASSYNTELKSGRLTMATGGGRVIWGYSQCIAIAASRLQLSGQRNNVGVDTTSLGQTINLTGGMYYIYSYTDPGDTVVIDTSGYNTVPDSDDVFYSWNKRVYYADPSGGQVTTGMFYHDGVSLRGIYTPDNGQICLYGGMSTPSSAAWVTELGTSNKYTHGITTNGPYSSIHLCRGSLANVLFGKRMGIYIGNGSSSNTISFNINNIPNVPRALMINDRSKFSFDTSSMGSVAQLVDLTALQSGTFKPPTMSFLDYNDASVGVSWTNTSCTSVQLSFTDFMVEKLNLEKVVYYWYAIA